MKAAGHEFVGLHAFFEFINRHSPNVRVPIMQLIDYRGYRLIASCVLPLGKDTIVYGSDDAAQTVHLDDAEMNGIMEQAGQFLNLKPHNVGPLKQRLVGPADIEGHRGRDGKLYVVDTARVFPPEPPTRSFIAIESGLASSNSLSDINIILRNYVKEIERYTGSSSAPRSWIGGEIYFDPNVRTIANDYASALLGRSVSSPAVIIPRGLMGKQLYNLLRPELVRCANAPLSSDAFTGFGLDDFRTHNKEVLEVYRHLLGTVIPKFVNSLDQGHLFPSDGAALTKLMHQHGINMRLAGLLRSMSTTPRVRHLLMVEMLTRVFKNLLRHKLRSAMHAAVRDANLERKKIIKQFNLFLGSSNTSDLYWRTVINTMLILKFRQYGPIWHPAEISEQSTRNGITLLERTPELRKAMFYRLKVQLGIDLVPQEVRFDFSNEFPFDGAFVELNSKSKRLQDNAFIEKLIHDAETIPGNSEVRLLKQCFDYYSDDLTGTLQSPETSAILIRLAQLYYAEGDLILLDQVMRQLSEFNLIPLEVAVNYHYLNARRSEDARDDEVAMRHYVRALRTACKLFGKGFLSGSADRNSKVWAPGHPFILVIMDRLIELLWRSNSRFLAYSYSMGFFSMWTRFPYYGDRTRFFIREWPLALLLRAELHLSDAFQYSHDACNYQFWSVKSHLDYLRSKTEPSKFKEASSAEWIRQVSLFSRFTFNHSGRFTSPQQGSNKHLVSPFCKRSKRISA
jgi:hypothetical protein